MDVENFKKEVYAAVARMEERGVSICAGRFGSHEILSGKYHVLPGDSCCPLTAVLDGVEFEPEGSMLSSLARRFDFPHELFWDFIDGFDMSYPLGSLKREESRKMFEFGRDLRAELGRKVVK